MDGNRLFSARKLATHFEVGSAMVVEEFKADRRCYRPRGGAEQAAALVVSVARPPCARGSSCGCQRPSRARRKRSGMLAHEWAHIRHAICGMLALERLLVPLLAVHAPWFWWLRARSGLDQSYWPTRPLPSTSPWNMPSARRLAQRAGEAPSLLRRTGHDGERVQATFPGVQ